MIRRRRAFIRRGRLSNNFSFKVGISYSSWRLFEVLLILGIKVFRPFAPLLSSTPSIFPFCVLPNKTQCICQLSVAACYS